MTLECDLANAASADVMVSKTTTTLFSRSISAKLFSKWKFRSGLNQLRASLRLNFLREEREGWDGLRLPPWDRQILMGAWPAIGKISWMTAC